MNKITWISISAALIIGVLMFGSYAAGQQTLTQASIQTQQFPQTTQQALPPQQIPDVSPEQWVSGPYRALIFEEKAWSQVSSEGGCIVYRSIGFELDPAFITVMGSEREFQRGYKKQGARVQVCGLTVHLPPASAGISKADEDK